MSTRAIVLTIASLCLSLPLSARAQSVDEMIQQLKGQPGTEEAIRELEAHRDEIEAAQRASRAQAGRAAKPTDIVPVHSFEDLAQLPQDAQQARKRYGRLPAMDGRSTTGDVENAKVIGRIQEWLMALSRGAMAPGPQAGSRVSPSQSKVLGELNRTWQKQRDEVSRLQQDYRQGQSRLEAAYRQQLLAIGNEYNARYDHCSNENTRAGGASCDPIRLQQDGKILEAGTRYLKALAAPYATLRTRMKQLAVEGQAVLDRANQAFPGGLPPMVSGPYGAILSSGIDALAAVAGADNDAVVLVHDQRINVQSEP